MIILRWVILLLAIKIKVVHCNINSSHLWWKEYYKHTKVQLRYKKNRTISLDHPFNIEYDFTSRFPIGFRGSFVCGATDHFGTHKCPIGIKGKEGNRLFFNELWDPKPHTKKKNQEGTPVSQLQQGGSVHKVSPNDFDYYQPNPIHSGEGRQNFGQFSRYNGNLDDQNRRVPLPPRVREEDHQKLEQEVNNMPTWMVKRSKKKTAFQVDKPTKPPAFLFSAVCFNSGSSNRVRPIPINIDNGLPAVAMRFGISDEKEMNFNVHLDSCAGLNIGNLDVHKWVITTYPYIVKHYIQFEDKDKFEPLGLNCAVNDVKDVENNVGKLTAIVTYYTRYTSVNKLPILLSFGLGNEVAVMQ